MRHEFTRFASRFSDEELETVWRFGGFGFDPQTGESTPYPGRQTVARFLEPIPNSWRDILRRAVRTKGTRPNLAALLAMLRTLTMRPVGIPLPAPAPLNLSPQWRCHRPIPARAP